MKRNLKRLLGMPLTPWQRQHMAAKVSIEDSENINNLEIIPESWTKIYHKGYVRLNEIYLPNKLLDVKVSLADVLKNRASSREFNDFKMNLNEISIILKYGFGINKDRNEERKYAPSAGARYPLEGYLISLNTELKRGLYHYYPKNHSLEKLLIEKSLEIDSYFNTKLFSWVKKASAIIVISAVFDRTIMKYGDRGYNFIFIDAGHVAQNICLVTTGLSRKVSPFASFYEDNLNKLFEFNPLQESVIYTLVIG